MNQKINPYGMCEACIMISLDKAFLEREKEGQLQEPEGQWAEN